MFARRTTNRWRSKWCVSLGLVLCWSLGSGSSAWAWAWPADGEVLRGFSLSGDTYAAGQHRGVDVALGGSAVRAPAAGEVTFAGSVPMNGTTVTISFAEYKVSLTHLGALRVRRGAHARKATPSPSPARPAKPSTRSPTSIWVSVSAPVRATSTRSRSFRLGAPPTLHLRPRRRPHHRLSPIPARRRRRAQPTRKSTPPRSRRRPLLHRMALVSPSRVASSWNRRHPHRARASGSGRPRRRRQHGPPGRRVQPALGRRARRLFDGAGFGRPKAEENACVRVQPM